MTISLATHLVGRSLEIETDDGITTLTIKDKEEQFDVEVDIELKILLQVLKETQE